MDHKFKSGDLVSVVLLRGEPIMGKFAFVTDKGEVFMNKILLWNGLFTGW